MSWLTSFFTWLVGLFVHEAVEQVVKAAEKPKTITDENTPPKLKAAVDADVQRQLDALPRLRP